MACLEEKGALTGKMKERAEGKLMKRHQRQMEEEKKDMKERRPFVPTVPTPPGPSLLSDL